MFLTCSSNQQNNGGGGGSTTTIINNYNYTNSLTNTENFATYPIISDHFTIAGTITYVNNHITSNQPITFTFNEDSLFVAASVANRQGINKIVLKNAIGGIVKTVPFNTNDVVGPVLFRSCDIYLDMNTELASFSWQTSQIYVARNYTDTGVVDQWPVEISGYTADGTKLTANPKIIIKFYYPAIIFNATFTGTVELFRDTKIYSSNVLEFPNPITRAEFDGTLTSMRYFVNYSVPQSFETITSLESHYFTRSGNTLTFQEPTFVKNIVMSGQASIALNGNNYVTNSFDKLLLARQITIPGLVSLDVATREHYEQLGGATKLITFDQPDGCINIENDYFTVTSQDQLNTPAMMLSGGVIHSADANSLAPFADQGIIQVQFKQLTLINYVTFSAGTTGILTIGNKNYTIAATVYVHDYVNNNAFACNSFIANYNGRMTGINLSATPDNYERDHENYITEDFSVKSVEFASTTFDTNVASNLGTPNVAFSGPGTGIGGGAGNGKNDVYLGRATQSNIVFDKLRWVKSVTVINSRIGYRMDYFINNINVGGCYLGNFGTNSVTTIMINKKIEEIRLTGNFAISSIVYSAANRQSFSINDNSSVPINLMTNNIGNYTVKITGNGTSILQAVKTNASQVGTISMQSSASATGETLFAQWPANSPLQVYHGITSGTGTSRYYVAYL